MSRLIIAVLSLCLAASLTAPAQAQSGDVRGSMTDVQRNALKDGCWKRYSGNERKRSACLNGQAYWENALRDGCYQRYSGNGSKLNQCLNTGNLSSGYSGGQGNYGNDDYYTRGGNGRSGYGTDRDMFEQALEYGCTIRYQGRRDRLAPCLNGQANSREAYADGCYRLYGRNPSTHQHCLNSYRDGGMNGYSGNRWGHGGNQNGYQSGPPNGYYGGNSSSGGNAISGLSDIQQNALKDGCWQRYSGNDRKRHACLNGDAYWQDALRDGCWKRYNGNQGKLDRCLRH